jgi:hypothetical protein
MLNKGHRPVAETMFRTNVSENRRVYPLHPGRRTKLDNLIKATNTCFL